MQQKSGDVIFCLRQIPFDLPGGVRHFVDFQIFFSDGTVESVDTKGVDTPMGKAKRKMVEDIYPIKIRIATRWNKKISCFTRTPSVRCCIRLPLRRNSERLFRQARETARQICMRAKRVEETHNYEKMSVSKFSAIAQNFSETISSWSTKLPRSPITNRAESRSPQT